jgi:SAM-dependent methyltransferase
VAEPGDTTLATYEIAAQRYRDRSAPPGQSLLAFLDCVAQLVGSGEILELGSGPGREALYLERRGLRVIRTDATPAFVEMMREDGIDARLLDIRTGEFGGPYAAIFAHAVLLHLTRPEFSDAVARARRAVVDGGLLAFTLKEGDGDAWSNAKLDLPRHFTYWREPAVRTVLDVTGWHLESIDHVEGRTEPWLHVIARAVIDRA